MKTLIEMHVLQNFAPSNLNRDDTGAPKDAFFGGTRRARMSSQCNKRAVRQFFNGKVLEGVFTPDDLAVRTKRLYQSIADALAGKRDPEEAFEKAKTALTYIKIQPGKNTTEKTQYLLFLGRREIEALAEAIDAHWDRIVPSTEEANGEAGEAADGEGETAEKEGDSENSNGDGKSKAKKKNKHDAKKEAANSAPQEVRKAIEAAFNGGKAVDVALFGRMLADFPEKNQNAACQVAHAISTHAVEREFDFYTAVDDLKPEDTAGADMLGTVEFNSACYYRYAVVDWEKLVENLQGDTELAAKGLHTFLQGFVVAEPTGKQNTFAAHNPPEFVAVTVCRDGAPRNLANAFETAIRAKTNESLTRKSVEELVKKGRALETAYPRKSETYVLDLTHTDLDGFGTKKGSLEDVLESALHAVWG